MVACSLGRGNRNDARSSQQSQQQQRRALLSLLGQLAVCCDFMSEREHCYLLGGTPLLFIICMFYNLICSLIPMLF